MMFSSDRENDLRVNMNPMSDFSTEHYLSRTKKLKVEKTSSMPIVGCGGNICYHVSKV
ncbi:MAG: hypothetical protein HRT89_11980 [Lentisphaeria bacterium]|nr:hypothetical protein [Lentisphaeria bacterium]